MKRIKYLIYACNYLEATDIARSYNINPAHFYYVRQADRDSANYGLPKGFRPDLSICVIKSMKWKHGSLDQVHRAWHEQLFDWQPEDIRQKFLDQVANTLDGFLYCDRTWSAWGYGTMSKDDFTEAGTDEVIYEHAVNMFIMFLEMKR